MEITVEITMAIYTDGKGKKYMLGRARPLPLSLVPYPPCLFLREWLDLLHFFP